MRFITFLTMTFVCQCFAHAAMTPSNSLQERIANIEQDIARLQQELKADEEEELDIISKGQNYMIADWPQYGHEIQEAKKKDLEVKSIKEKIKQLQQEKERLLSQPSS